MSTGTKTIKSDGDLSARGYAAMDVRPATREPSRVEQRVVVLSPSQTATRTGPRAGSGPRNPQQMTWPPAKGPAIVLPDGRPLTKAQRFWIDPELFARWDAEAKAGQAT